MKFRICSQESGIGIIRSLSFIVVVRHGIRREFSNCWESFMPHFYELVEKLTKLNDLRRQAMLGGFL